MSYSKNELAIIKCLIKFGALSAREIHDHTEKQTEWSLSSTRKTIERMVEKNRLTKEKFHGITIYNAKDEKVKVIGTLITQLKSFLEIEDGLSAAHFTNSALLNEDDIAELEQYINDAKNKQ